MSEQQAFEAAHRAYPEMQKPNVALAFTGVEMPVWAVWHDSWGDTMIVTDGCKANFFHMVETRDVPS